MPVPLALMAGGTALQIAGQYRANLAKARAAKANAAWYDEQAEFAAESMRRSLRLTEARYAQAFGAQSSAYAASGVDVGSGSALNVLAGTLTDMYAELDAVRKQGELNIKLARLRGRLEATEARNLSSFGTNFMQGMGTFMTNYTATQGFGRGFPNWMTPSGPVPDFQMPGSYLYSSSPSPYDAGYRSHFGYGG